MSAKKVFYIMAGFVALAVIATIGMAVLGNNMLQKSAEHLVELRLETRLLEEQQKSLIIAKKEIEENYELEQIAKTVVPQEKDQARTVREIINLANAAGVRIGSITFPSSNLGQRSTAPAPSRESSEDSGAQAPAAPPVTQVRPVEGIPGVFQLELTVQSDPGAPVSYERFINFLVRLENNRRTAQVTSINVTPSQTAPGNVTFSLVVNVFIKP